MTKKWTGPLMAALLSVYLWPASAFAASGLPAYYPDTWEIVGPLNGVSVQEGYIVIMDFALPLDPAAQVGTPQSQFDTIDHLRPGMIVGVGVRPHRRAQVTRVWVLPPDWQEEPTNEGESR